MAEHFRFEDPHQAQLYEDSRKIGEWPAAGFRDECRFFANHASVADLETSAHLAVHLQREIKSAIAKVLVPLDFKTPKEMDVDTVINGLLRSLGCDAD